jgi:hypothetical protein
MPRFSEHVEMNGNFTHLTAVRYESDGGFVRAGRKIFYLFRTCAKEMFTTENFLDAIVARGHNALCPLPEGKPAADHFPHLPAPKSRT